MSHIIVFDEDQDVATAVDVATDVLVFEVAAPPVATETGSENQFLLLDSQPQMQLVFDAPPPVVDVVVAPQDFILIDGLGQPAVLRSAETDEDILLVTTSGPTGATGPQGLSAYDLWLQSGQVGTVDDYLDSLIGPVGPSGQSYRHIQDIATTEWVIDHNLGYQPGGITVQDSAGTTWEGDVTHPSPNTVHVSFQVPLSGTAHLS